VIEALKHFHIDPERVRRERDAAASIGRAYRDTKAFSDADRELLQYAAATQFRRAGAHSLLLDDVKRAREQFHEAAKIYFESRIAYGSLIERLAYSEPAPPLERDEVHVRASDAFYLWDSAASRDRNIEINMSLRRRLEPYRADAIGVFGIPAGVYLDVYDAVRRAQDLKREVGLSLIAEAALPLLSAYEVAVRRARADHFHWQRLAMPIHPVEPDVVALLVALDSSMKQMETSVSAVIGRIPLSEDTNSLLRESLREYDAWRD